jgi:hypothetical protein
MPGAFAPLLFLLDFFVSWQQPVLKSRSNVMFLIGSSVVSSASSPTSRRKHLSPSQRPVTSMSAGIHANGVSLMSDFKITKLEFGTVISF